MLTKQNKEKLVDDEFAKFDEVLVILKRIELKINKLKDDDRNKLLSK